MNWTGGRLSRHSGTSNPVKDRQKQHFARVQQVFHGGLKTNSPIEWAFFDNFEQSREGSQHQSSGAQHRLHRAKGRPKSQSSRQQHDRLSSDKILALQYNSRHSTQSQEPLSSGRSLSPFKNPNKIPDKDLYNNSPQPHKLRRQQDDSMPRSETEHLTTQAEEEESVAEKRSKILRKGDWVGINIQRPLQLAFASPKEEEKIGRRRKLADGHRARYSSKQMSIRSPFHTRNRLLANQNSSQEVPERREPARTDIRISIGGRVVPPGISSSSAARRIGSQSTLTRRRSSTTSSDVMLLDADVSFAQESPRLATTNIGHRSHSVSTRQSASRSQDFRPIGTLLSDEVEQGDLTSDKAGGIRNQWAGTLVDSELPPNVQSSQDLFEAYPHSQRTSLSPSRDYNKNYHPGRLLFSSPAASILHPAPRSSKVSVILRSASQSIAESTVIQVGKAKNVVPSSQVLENEMWETWIAPEQDYDRSSKDAYFSESRNIQMISVSPGISTGPAMRHAHTERSEKGNEDLPHRQGSNLDEGKSRCEKLNTTTSAFSNRRVRMSSSLVQGTEIVEKKLEGNTRGVAPFCKKLRKATSLNVSPEKETIDEDQNKLWVNFLFGGNSEVAATIPNPKFNVISRHRRQLSGSPILGQTSGDGPDLSGSGSALQATYMPPASSTRSGIPRIAEASPCPTVSICRESNMEMVSTMDCPSQKDGISVQAERGSLLASSSDSISASIAVQAVSQCSPCHLVVTRDYTDRKGRSRSQNLSHSWDIRRI